MNSSEQTATNMLAFWHLLEAQSVLQCPVCRGALIVGDQSFQCASCAATFPVEGGVPLLMKPDEVISIPDRVMEVFNIPAAFKDRVEAALSPLTMYRTNSHPEFANFFARFDPPATPVEATAINLADVASSIDKVECLTTRFPKTIRSDEAEFRSIRLRNNSDRILLTDDRNPLFLSYKLFDKNGIPVAFDGERSSLPWSIPPGGELTVPVKIRLPAGATGEFAIRFHFVAVIPAPERAYRERSWMYALRDGFRRSSDAKPIVSARQSPPQIHWFDNSPLTTMTFTATSEKAEFPAIACGVLQEFTVEQDVSRAEGFVVDVIEKLRSLGVSKPRILEIGAGVHPISLRTCGENSTIVVSDISLVMQTLASIMHTNNPAILDQRAAFASFDMMYPPFKDGSFDIICICAALHHIPSPHEFLKRLAPLLSEHGRFVAVREPCLVDPTAPGYIGELTNGFNEQMFELSEWQEMISSGGLVLDSAVIDFECSLKFSAGLPFAR